MNPITKQIIEFEWSMFTQVQNEGGRASCQDDPETFRIMRGSQFDAWDEKTRESYLEDLYAAQAAGRNLLMEKYAYMMQDSDPVAFEKIKDRLPLLSRKKKSIVEEIVEKTLVMQDDFSSRYPLLVSTGRPTRTQDEVYGNTSIETYLRGELFTYSIETLTRYRAYLNDLETTGQNIASIIMLYTVRAYGYSDLDQAEKSLERRATSRNR